MLNAFAAVRSANHAKQLLALGEPIRAPGSQSARPGQSELAPEIGTATKSSSKQSLCHLLDAGDTITNMDG
jgi:hypothetical protein